jgi:glycerol kinase
MYHAGYHTKAHIVKAALESVAFQTKDVLDAMHLESSVFPSVLKVDGGMTKNNILMKFLCDLIDCDLNVPTISETTALGACLAAGLSLGLWKSLDEIKALYKVDRVVRPTMHNSTRLVAVSYV